MKPKKENKQVFSAFSVFKKKNNDGIKKREAPSKNEEKIETALSRSLKEDLVKPTPKLKRKSKSNRLSVGITENQIKPVISKKLSPCGNEESDKCFTWLISPVTPVDFFSTYWEKQPLHIRDRNNENYPLHADMFSCKEFDRMLKNHHLEYKTNIDVVTYKDGKRETLDIDGRAYAAIIWDYFQNGHSIRLLNPQSYHLRMTRMCSLLQEYFGSFVGINMYLTPPGSQGFAPHYDDIEAFVLQLEGRKHWQIYAPRNDQEELPRYSSKNFDQKKIGKPILEVELKPGDLLYFPRGFIHQAKTSESYHSLHITISTYQLNTWGDILQKLLPRALEQAMEENIEYRQSLPKDYMNYMGVSTDNPEDGDRQSFVLNLISLTKGLSKYLPADTGCDLMAKDFIHSAIPPVLSKVERDCSIHGSCDTWKEGDVPNTIELQPHTKIAFIRKRAVRVVHEDQKIHLYHTFENSRVYKEREPQYVEITWDLLPGVEMLISSHPDFIAIEELPLQNLEEQLDLATLLYDKGLIRTERPFVEITNGCDK